MSKDEPPAHQYTGRIKDARGRRVTQLDPITLRLGGRLEGIPPDLLQDMCGRIGTRMTRTELWLFGSPRIMHWVIRLSVVGFSLLLAMCVAVAIIRPLAVGSTMRYLLPLSASLAFLYLLWIVARRIRSRRVIEIMFENLRCPHCAYDIRGLPTDPEDGATVCPECGCAWRLDETADSGVASSTERPR
ncbi:unnamed protein product [marine sediment metagenome]|uniref:Uncharacterized protein n=1 Tax=marine sediment metagenome TaxID=412755 RepID=X0RLV4_9ZZZZ